jgi:hypothetical protein
VQTFIVRTALVAAFLLPAACGSSSPSTTTSSQTASFKARYSSAISQFKRTSKAIGNAITKAPTQTNGQIATTFKDLAGQWQGDVSKLETLTPPASVATRFNTLTAAATRAESDLNAIVAAAETNSASAAKQASATLVTDVLDAKTASQRIGKALGIK